MRLSYSALALCAQKYDRGALTGLNVPANTSIAAFSERELEEIANELVTSGFLEVDETEARLSALGRLFLDMMVKPEVYISLDNSLTGIHANLYVHDARYLCVMDAATSASEGRDRKLYIDLLPNLKQVVSLFAYMIHLDSVPASDEEVEGVTHHPVELSVRGMAWDELHELINEWWVDAFYRNDALWCSVSETSGTLVQSKTPTPYEDSAVVNGVTRWLFARLSESMTTEGGAR